MKLILDTKLIKLYGKDEEIHAHILMSNGKTLEMNTYKADLPGMIAALTLSQEVLAGKFWPKGTIDALVLSDEKKVLSISK